MATNVAHTMDIAERIVARRVFSRCLDDSHGRMVGILRVARSAIRLCSIILF